MSWTRWLTWMAGFIAFPIAGLAGRGVVGRVDDPLAALVGGTVAGAVIGTGQWLASRREVGEPAAWIGASAGAWGSVFRGRGGRRLPDGPRRARAHGRDHRRPPRRRSGARDRRRWPRAWSWALAMPALWALGWSVSTAIGVDVERQYVGFGDAGAITVMALSGLLFEWLRSAHRPPKAAE